MGRTGCGDLGLAPVGGAMLSNLFLFQLGKEYVKAIHCHPTYLTYMQSTSCEMQGWMKDKVESRLLGEKSITSDM